MDRPIRLIEMLHRLGGGRSWRAAELADGFGVSERTIYRDMQALSRLHAIPVTSDEYGWRLGDGATLRKLPLTAAERATLTLLLRHPALGHAAELTEGLRQKLDGGLQQQPTPAPTLAGPERSGNIMRGLPQLLQQAIQERKCVQLLYRSLWSLQQAWRKLDPYAVFHRENVWYLVGHCHMRREPRTFRLDRIVDARCIERSFKRPGFDLDTFLKHSWSVHWGRAMHKVVIHFDATVGLLIEAGRHHPDEGVHRLPNGRLEYRVTLSHLDEIARWIVGFAGAARAIRPPALVTRVAEIARGAYERHRRGDGENPDAADAADAADRQHKLPGMASTHDGRRAASLPGLL